MKHRKPFFIVCLAASLLCSCADKKGSSSLESGSSSSDLSLSSSSSSSSLEDESLPEVRIVEAEGIRASGGGRYEVGEEVVIGISVAKGYKLLGASLNGIPAAISNNHLRFTMGEDDVEVAFEIEHCLYSVILDCQYGVYATADKTQAHCGETVSLEVEALDGYAFDHIEVNGLTIEGLSFAMGEEDARVKVFSSVSQSIAQTPENLAISGSILSFVPVIGATSYLIRINGQDSFETTQNSIDLAQSPASSYLVPGINEIEVAAKASGSFTSFYSNPIEYLFGVDAEAVDGFLKSVESIGEVTLDSQSAIASAIAYYKGMDSVSKLDPRVDGALETLKESDGAYFLLLVEKAAESLKEEDITSAQDYYSAMLGKDSPSATTALGIALGENCSAKPVHYSSYSRLYVFAYCLNVLGQKIAASAPEVHSGGELIPLSGGDGAYYLSAQEGESYSLSFNGHDYGQLTMPSRLSGFVFGITDGGAFGSSVESFDHYVTEAYLSSSVSADLTLATEPLVSVTSTSQSFSPSSLDEALYRAGYGGQTLSLKLLIYGIDGEGNTSYIDPQSVHDYSLTVMDSLRLSAFGTIRVIPAGSNDEGRVEWPWEIFMENANPQSDEVDTLNLIVIDEKGSEAGTIVMDYEAGDRYLMKQDVIEWLNESGLPLGRYSFKPYLKAKPGSEYGDSPFYPTTDYYDYAA